ncbi:uncharacterized protein LOC119838269 [Zerene cesonia]|uniref:uncharacterized protein LOC119838269 n=1 Tax=Zerene cesonia TaxID=33412 RepID=UPI0018E537C0|nr:uncharacterized protein LOC119838269 [Zerene cesonia]
MRNNKPSDSNSRDSDNSRDVELLAILESEEAQYPMWWSHDCIMRTFYHLPNKTLWNSYICVIVLVALVLVATVKLKGTLIDWIYNVSYTIHVLAILCQVLGRLQYSYFDFWTAVSFLMDLFTFSHYMVQTGDFELYEIVCYYMRLHRPLRYLWSLNNESMKGSVLGTTLKYCYIFLVLRVTWALIWIRLGIFSEVFAEESGTSVRQLYNPGKKQASEPIQFLIILYVLNKMFIPIGTSVKPGNDGERIASLLVMLTGCFVVTGVAVASLSLVISLYMRPEETFRSRYRLIMKEMKESHVPPGLRHKVETFYKMYWHKQRAVSATRLLPIFPPTLVATIYTDIYFRATQKSHILRELSYQFLSELAKKMQTIHYIPGDAIIKRNTKKSSIIYVTYGDVEMLTAEDDSTAILRMTRGTILSPYAGCPAACGRAHVDIRAATFCIAHVLHAAELWKTALRYGQGSVILGAFYDHFERVKRHYLWKNPEDAAFKSSILHFKRKLLELKEARDENELPQLAKTDVMMEIAGSYVMRNRADASLTEESDAICLRMTFPCILQPSSSLLVAWHSFVTCLILAVCITHPYYLVYKKEVPVEFRFYDYAVTTVFVLDLIVHLSTGDNVEDGVPITLAQTASQQARSGWFLLDVLATLPIFEFIKDGHFAGINKIVRLHKVFRMLKAVEDECVYHSNLLRFFSYSLLLLIACYLLAALQQGFMCYGFGYCLVKNITHTPFWNAEPLDDTVESRLTFSLYWSISMITFTTHMEDFGTGNQESVIYIMLVLELCIVLHIFMEAVYSATIMVTTAMRENYDACIENVTNFLRRNEVEPILIHRFKSYLELCWYTDKAYSMTNKKKSIFHDLPPHVHQDIVTRQRSKYMLCIPFMKFLHKEELKTISSNARLFCSCPNEILLSTGDISNEMYVIKQGICEVLCPVTKTVVGELTARNHFGVVVCLLRLPAFYTIRAVTHVQVFSISRKYLLNVIEIPQIKDAIDDVKELPEYEYLQIPYPPFVWYEPAPPTPNVERFPMPRKHEKDFAFLHPFNRLGFLSILRYIFPRFTIRPDGPYLSRYEWFRVACALLSAALFPAMAYLTYYWDFVRLALDLTAYLDILQRILVGYYNEKGLLVYHPASTAAHYLKGTFLIDLLACLPLEKLELSIKETYDGQYHLRPMAQYLYLNRLIQLYRTPSALISLKGYVRRDIIIVLKAIPPFLALLNVLTCLIIFNSVKLLVSPESFHLIPFNDDGGSWIHLYQNVFRFNITENPWNLHLATYFWAVYETTSTGYSTFNPTNFVLMRILIAGMIIGAMITTYFSVRIISTRANVNRSLASFQQHMKDIARFMKRENLDAGLKKQVLEYYKHKWDKMAGMDYRKVLKLCDQITLRTDAILYIYGPTFSKCPIVNKCEISLLRMIGRAVRTIHFLKDTKIISRDDIITDLYFVDQGVLEVRYEDMDSVQLGKGSIFGNLNGVESIRSPVEIMSISQVHLLHINTLIFHGIIADFPSVINELVDHLKYNQDYVIGLEEIIKPDSKEPTTYHIMYRIGQRFLNFTLHQTSAIQIYLITVSLACIYTDVYNAGFQDNQTSLIVGLYFMDLGFSWKFLIKYFLPHSVDQNNELTTSLWKDRKRYFGREFKMDIISVIPFEALCLMSSSNRLLLFSWLRLNRFFRIVTVYKCLQQRHESISSNLILTTTISVFIWMTLFIHVTACCWYFIGVMEEEAEPKSSWFYDEYGRYLCKNKYICSLYFVLTTFTQNGVGDILPKKQSEVLFVSILQIFSIMIYMIYVGEFSNIIQYYSFRSFGYYCKIMELQEFLKNNRVSRNLVNLVHKYSIHLWIESRGVQLPIFLKKAPNCIKLEVMSAAYLHHLHAHPIFRQCEPVFLRQLVGCFQLYTYNKGMHVVKENETTDSMYFVHSGRVLETCENDSNTRLYFAGESFGTIYGLIHNLPYAYSYITVMKSQVLSLCLKDWKKLLSHFPDSREIIKKSLKYDDNPPDNKPDRPRKERKVTIAENVSASHENPSASEIKTEESPLERQQTILDSLPPIEPLDHDETVDLPDSYLWPTDSRRNSLEEEKILTETTDNIPLDLEVSRSVSSDLPKINMTDQDLLLNEEVEEATDALLAKIEGTDISSDEYRRTQSPVVDKLKRELPDENMEELPHMKSVEDYILERYGEDTAIEEPAATTTTEAIDDVHPTSTTRLKHSARVRYRENTEETKHSTVEPHEIKPIRDLSTNEKNFNSLDSDIDPNVVIEADISGSTESLMDSDSESSISEELRSLKSKKKKKN